TPSVTPDSVSFPTRRSSDLTRSQCIGWLLGSLGRDPSGRTFDARRSTFDVRRSTFDVRRSHSGGLGLGTTPWRRRASRHPRFTRLEEHTSELQSRENLVCRL